MTDEVPDLCANLKDSLRSTRRAVPEAQDDDLRLREWATSLADPHFCLSVPEEAKRVIRALLAALDRVEADRDEWASVGGEHDIARRAAEAEHDGALSTIQQVRDLHAPVEALNVRYNRRQKVCAACGTDDGNWQLWPCPTVRLLPDAATQHEGS
ncbi:hypothetical protein SEA_GUACAMOLE_76 [Gordonia phage Guacamole]|uniref:hypothetical protein n=1 Tax=Gordonia phage Guacamole TaxID=1821553 RepID=UPI00078BE52C|nr:hypothetical protein BJD65_gp76 [Gordonia phage Guacamole]AMS03567.1 hypothetical protein SEA_GUACAMOLE_76 [Gordonia phage Guacamole]QDM56813.1 hypothetical protein SEA_JASPERJR_76 [Gordonia phage JasperJr]